MAALPTLAHAFVGAAFERDFAVAGLVSSAAVFHTLGLVLLGAIFQRSLPGEGVSPWALSSWRAADRVGQRRHDAKSRPATPLSAVTAGRDRERTPSGVASSRFR